jgi:hypothetical protein
MKVQELITRLQDFDSDLDVEVLTESTTWGYDEDKGSYEMFCVDWGSVQEVVQRENRVYIYVNSSDLERI